jgi:D-aminoacyl-tRNA deacylase
MNLIIASEADSASINLKSRLLEMAKWVEDGDFNGKRVWRLTEDHGDFCLKDTRLITIEELHIHAEGIDKDWEEKTDIEIENIVFLSRHKAASGRPSLTVHPIGNWGKADYGGAEGTVSGASPKWMTGLLLNIYKNRLLGYDVCFEATHHGPLIEKPSMFLEIGSGEEQWELKEPAEALIKSLLELEAANGVNAIGIGGGHYTPRFTEAAISHKVCFGHMIANYGISPLTPEILNAAIKSCGADGLYFHRKGMKRSDYRKWKEYAEEKGITVFNQSDYEIRGL